MEYITKYNKTNDIQIQLNQSMVRRYFNMLSWKPKESVLDIGMGDGKWTVEGLLPALPGDLETLIGCDNVPWKVDFAMSNYSHPKVRFVQLDIATKQLKEEYREKFDHIFSFWALHWVRDLRTALANMFSMMKPGGEFLVVVVEKGMDLALDGISKYERWSGYNHAAHVSEFLGVEDRLPLWRNLLTEVGFVNLNGFKENMIYEQKSKEVMEEMIKSMNPVIVDIPPEDLEDYKKDFVKEIYRSGLCRIDICPETQKEIPTTNFASIIIYGKKPDVQ